MIAISRALFAALAATICLFTSPGAQAADFPSRTVTIIVGNPAGGPMDVLIRAMVPRLSEMWKQPVVVENRIGANESIAAQFVSRAPADGHTLLLSTETPLTQNQFLYDKLRYDPEKDFVPVTRMVSSPLIFVVPASLPVNTIEEFIALAKSRAATKPLSYASAGTGSVIHLPLAIFSKQHGLNMLHVPYKGVVPLLPDLVSGQIDASMIGVSAATPFVRDGKLKALVSAAPERTRSLPQVPVFSETSVPPLQADFMVAIVAPAGTPSAVAEKISAAVKQVLTDPKFREIYVDPFGYIIIASTPAEFGRYLAADRPLQAERIKTSGARLN